MSPIELLRGALVPSLALAALGSPVSAQLKLGTSPSGVLRIYNETRIQHARRVADRLLPVPEHALAPILERHAARNALDLRLVKAVVQVESGYNQAALSSRGAMGLMQLMPETARDLAVGDPYDPEQNVRAGTSYLRRLLDRYDGRVELALAAYNAGPSTVDRYGGIPPFPETRGYVLRVLRLYRGPDARLPPARRPGRKTFLVQRPGERPLLTTDPDATPR